MSKNKPVGPRRYSKKYFQPPFPPNHNPIIGSLRLDTLNNAHNALCLLREISEQRNYQIDGEIENGLFFLMSCVIDAIRFEIYNRE